MNYKGIFTAAVALFLVTGTMAFAGHHYHGHGCATMPSWNMNEMDADKDGGLSFEEYMESYRSQLRGGFDVIDADRDGVISGEEWASFLKVHGMDQN